MARTVNGYPQGYGQPAAAITYQLNGAQVGRGNTLNIEGSGVTFKAGADKGTYTISGGGGGGGVTFLNGLTGALTIMPGTGISVTPVGSEITIAINETGNPNQIRFFNGSGLSSSSPKLTYQDGMNILSMFDNTGTSRVLYMDPSLNSYYFGEFEGGSGTYVQVDDANTTLWLNSPGIVQGGNIGLGNNTYFTVDDPQQKFLVSGLWPNMAVADGLSLNFATGSFIIGDAQTNGQGTRFDINDPSLRTDLYTQDLYVRGYNNNIGIFAEITNTYSDVSLGDASGVNTTTVLRVLDSQASVKMEGVFGKSFLADMSVNYVVSMGALDIGNGTKVVIDDTFGVTTVVGGNVSGGGLLVQDSALASWFRVDTSNAIHTTTIGDISSVGTDTLFTVDDISAIISSKTDNVFFVSDTASNKMFDVNVANRVIKSGDIGSIGFDTVLTVDDTNKAVTSTLDGVYAVQNVAGKNALEIDTVNRTAILGWTAVGTNSNFIAIDDANNDTRIRLNAGNAFFAITQSGGSIGNVFTYTVADNAFRVLKSRFETAKGNNVATASTITLGGDGNVFVVTGNTTVNLINGTNWEQGSEITLQFPDSPTLKHNQAPSAGNLSIFLSGSTDFVMTNLTTMKFVRIGSTWYELSRTVA